MVISVANLRADFPEFASTVVYPDAGVQFWLTAAYLRLVDASWVTAGLQDTGAELYACHELALEARAQAQAAKGAPPGETVGAVSNKSVDKVSVGFDVGSTSEEGAGYFNQTIYGKRFWTLAMAVGGSVAAVQIRPGC